MTTGYATATPGNPVLIKDVPIGATIAIGPGDQSVEVSGYLSNGGTPRSLPSAPLSAGSQLVTVSPYIAVICDVVDGSAFIEWAWTDPRYAD